MAASAVNMRVYGVGKHAHSAVHLALRRGAQTNNMRTPGVLCLPARARTFRICWGGRSGAAVNVRFRVICVVSASGLCAGLTTLVDLVGNRFTLRAVIRRLWR